MNKPTDRCINTLSELKEYLELLAKTRKLPARFYHCFPNGDPDYLTPDIPLMLFAIDAMGDKNELVGVVTLLSLYEEEQSRIEDVNVKSLFPPRNKFSDNGKADSKTIVASGEKVKAIENDRLKAEEEFKAKAEADAKAKEEAAEKEKARIEAEKKLIVDEYATLSKKETVQDSPKSDSNQGIPFSEPKEPEVVVSEVVTPEPVSPVVESPAVRPDVTAEGFVNYTEDQLALMEKNDLEFIAYEMGINPKKMGYSVLKKMRECILKRLEGIEAFEKWVLSVGPKVYLEYVYMVDKAAYFKESKYSAFPKKGVVETEDANDEDKNATDAIVSSPANKAPEPQQSNIPTEKPVKTKAGKVKSDPDPEPVSGTGKHGGTDMSIFNFDDDNTRGVEAFCYLYSLLEAEKLNDSNIGDKLKSLGIASQYQNMQEFCELAPVGEIERVLLSF